MAEKMRLIIVDKNDHKIIVNALSDKRHELIEKGESTDLINNVLLKVVDAPEKKIGLFCREER